MTRTLTTILALLISLCSFAYTVDDLPVSTQFRDSLDFNAVCNPDGVLTHQEVDSLNAMLWSMRKHQGVQGLVIAIHESDPDDPYQFTIDVARKYGVGTKRSTGFVMLVTTKQRGYQIITGDGMDKYLTDAHCSQIGRNNMVPHFRNAEWGRGLIAGISTIKAIVSGEAELNQLSPANDTDDDEDITAVIIFLTLFLGVCALYIYLFYRKYQLCPMCKKHHYKMIKRTVTRVEGDKKKVIVVDLYHCNDCFYRHERQYHSTTDHYFLGTFNGKGPKGWGDKLSAAAAAAAMTAADRNNRHGGWGGGFSSGGSSFHSTFGGGSFSGGGAGGRF